jgi:hypothetical protein
VFRRRRRDVEDAERLEPEYYTDEYDTDEPGDLDEPGEYGDDEVAEQAQEAVGGTGPWDSNEPYPRRERVDFGSLLVPDRDGFEIRINVVEGTTGISVDVLSGDPARGGSGLQLQAFAAPKSSGLWDDVRQEIAEEVAKSGGRSEQTHGPHGTELFAMVSTGGRSQPEPNRFLGVDGPRWFLRGVISGPAARHPELARPFEELFGDVVVVRGDHPAPPRELLLLRLPEDAQPALAEQAGDQPAGPEYPNPFERGPEITETR